MNKGAYHVYPQIEAICSACGEPFRAKTRAARYCDEPDCMRARKAAQKRKVYQSSKSGEVQP